MNSFVCVFLAVVCLQSVSSKSVASDLLARLLSRSNTNNENEVRAFHEADEAARQEYLLNQLVQALGQQDKRQTITGGLTCGSIDSNAVAAAWNDDASNKGCLYGYHLDDWIKTFDEISSNPGDRSSDFVDMVNCLGDVMKPLLQTEKDSRDNLNTIPNSCGAWAGRYTPSNSGHPIEGCDSALADAGITIPQLQDLMTANIACRMHQDMDLLEGIIAAVGPIGGMSGNPPVELCVFSSLKTDARWFRANEPENVGDCGYRMESKRSDVGDLINELLRRALTN